MHRQTILSASLIAVIQIRIVGAVGRKSASLRSMRTKAIGALTVVVTALNAGAFRVT